MAQKLGRVKPAIITQSATWKPSIASLPLSSYLGSPRRIVKDSERPVTPSRLRVLINNHGHGQGTLVKLGLRVMIIGDTMDVEVVLVEHFGHMSTTHDAVGAHKCSPKNFGPAVGRLWGKIMS